MLAAGAGERCRRSCADATSPTSTPPTPGRGRGARAAKTPKEAAPIDLTGYWVSIVTEDWRFRMVTPPKGDYPNFLAQRRGHQARRRVGPGERRGRRRITARPTARRTSCACPAASTSPGPTTATLKIETDAGMQTRLLRFDAPPGPAGAAVAPGRRRWRSGSGKALRVDTTNLLPGYLQTNGVPYSANLTMMEYFDVIKEPGGEVWLIDDAVDHGSGVSGAESSSAARTCGSRRIIAGLGSPEACLVR